MKKLICILLLFSGFFSNGQTIWDDAYNNVKNVNYIISGDSRRDLSYTRYEEYISGLLANLNITTNNNYVGGQSMLEWTNNTFSGNSTSSNVVSEAISQTPGDGSNTILEFSLGQNDVDTDVAGYETLLNNALDAYLGSKPNTTIILVTPEYAVNTSNTTNMRNAYLNVGAARNIKVVDTYDIMGDVFGDPDYYEDNIHQNYGGSVREINFILEDIIPTNLKPLLTLPTLTGTSLTQNDVNFGMTITLGQPLNTSGISSFPSVIGYGKNTTGGRGGQIIHVTNLNNSGSGSLREALETSGDRIIVFDVAGDIDISSILIIGSSSNLSTNIARGNVTILGETAPSPGITIRGEGINIYTSNVIISHITVRADNATDDVDGIRIRNVHNGYDMQNIVLYRITSTHAEDECISIQPLNSSSRITNVTIQECLMYASNPASPYSMLVGPYVQNLSIIRNMFALNGDRNPFIGYGLSGETVEGFNNIIYGFKEGSHVAFGNTVDWIVNYYRPSNDDPPSGDYIKYYENTYNNPGAVETDGDIYHTGNLFDGTPQVDAIWNTANESSRRLTNSLIPDNSWLTTLAEIEAAVLPVVGNSLYREQLDQDMINHYNSKTGTRGLKTITNKSSTSHPASYDTDNDGISDAFESAYLGGLSASDSGDNDSDGVTNIEEFALHLIGLQTGQGASASSNPSPQSSASSVILSRRNFK